MQRKLIITIGLLSVICAGAAAQTMREAGWGIEVFSRVTAPSVSIDFDLLGNVYVANCGSHYVTIPVWKINPQGTPAPFGDSIACGDSLAFNSAYLLHAGSGAGVIYKITADGTTSLFVSGGGLNNVNGLDFDSANILYAANTSTGTVSKILPTGTVSTFASGLGAACGLAVSSGGSIFTADATSGRIYRISPAGISEVYVTLPSGGTCGLAFDASGNLYGTSSATGRVYKVTPGLSTTVFADGFTNPLGLGVSPGGDIYLSDNDAYIVYRMFRLTPTPTPSPAPVPSTSSAGLFLLAAVFGGVFLWVMRSR